MESTETNVDKIEALLKQWGMKKLTMRAEKAGSDAKVEAKADLPQTQRGSKDEVHGGSKKGSDFTALDRRKKTKRQRMKAIQLATVLRAWDSRGNR